MGEVRRQKYGFKWFFFSNTHHYFAEFYTAWFLGSAIAKGTSQVREWLQLQLGEETSFDYAADNMNANVAEMHARTIRGLATQGRYTTTVVDYEKSHYPFGEIKTKDITNALVELPQLLLRDACSVSDAEITAGWPQY